MVKILPKFEYFTEFLKNKNIILKIKRSKVTDYAALTLCILMDFLIQINTIWMGVSIIYFKGSQVEKSKY